MTKPSRGLCMVQACARSGSGCRVTAVVALAR